MKENKYLSSLFWIGALYFFSGLPFGFFYTFLPVYLRMEGVDLIKIGLLSSAGIFWSLKPLWAPLIDRYGYKSLWISSSLFGLSFTLLSLTFLPPGSLSFSLLLFALTFFSALLDTALDGFIIEYIPKDILGKANGIRLSTYRIALIFSGGIFVALAEYFQFRALIVFLSLFCALGGFIILTNGNLRIKPSKVSSFNLFEQYLFPLNDLLQREKAFLILLLVATYKIGDALLGGMIYPFWVDKGFSKLEIGFISGTLGSIFTILGSLLGGYITERWGVKRALLNLGLLQALSNLGYTLVAYPGIYKKWIYAASVIESFTGGLGTAAFVTFITSLCKKEVSSSQYAIFSTLFSLTLVISRSISGFGAKTLGYFHFFGLTFFIALLPLLLIPFIFKENSQ
ncbi:MAG: MFS transporter [Caldimicrobium sp.]